MKSELFVSLDEQISLIETLLNVDIFLFLISYPAFKHWKLKLVS